MADGTNGAGRVSRLSLAGAYAAAVPRELREPVPSEHLHYVARDLVASEIDRWLRVLSRQEARCRAVFGRLAAIFLRQQAQHRLGFRRVGDYSRERLGLSARELQTAARVVTALAALPRLATAFATGELTWTQLRILVTVATPATEEHWLNLARGCTVRALDVLARADASTPLVVDGTDVPAATSGAATAAAKSAGIGSAESISRPEANGASAAGNAVGDVDALMDGEPIVRFHLRCPRRVRRLWHRAVELARRMLGGDGPVWQAAEAIAAEGLAGPQVSGDAWGSFASEAAGGVAAIPGAGADAIRANQPDGESSISESGRPPAWECLDWSAVRAAMPAEIERLVEDCDRLDAFALDARLRQVLQAQRRIDWQLGRLLHTFLRLRLERILGFSSVAAYARERLGLSPSKVRGLVAVERKTWEVLDFGAAYEAGDLSWVRALTLLPVLGERTAATWTARAQAVTVRRLVAEVDWSLDQLDAKPALTVPPGPPPAGHGLTADVAKAERQIRAPSDASPEWSPADAEVAFAGPASVVTLVQAAVAAFRRPGEPRWAGFERLLAHVASEWEALPRHEDPIFDRDGWRCAVPACGARGNLHDHHLQFRSQGGSNAPENRLSVCVWHHLRGIHAGIVRASGTAPAEVRWELGLRAGQPPLLSFIGDTYVSGETYGSGKRHARRDGSALVAQVAEGRSAAA